MTLILLALTLAPVTHVNAGYLYTTIDKPGATGTQLRGINNSGQIVGFANGQGFLYSGNTYTTLNGLAYATGINNSGQIVGEIASEQGYLLSSGIYFQLPAGLGVTGINDAGQMVGFFTNGTGGYLLNGLLGNLTPINLGAGTEITAINNGGQMLASTYGGSYLLSGANVTAISVPGSKDTFAYGINNSGQIVGYYDTVNGFHHGFLLSGGIYTMIDVPGPSVPYTDPFRINDLGQIVGIYVDNGSVNGFLATPGGLATPEPSSLMILLTGLSASGFVRLRRRRSPACENRWRFIF